MSFEANVKLYLKSIIFALLGIASAGAGVYLVGFFNGYFNVHPFFAHIAIFSSVGLDIFGAGIPLVVGLVCAALFVGYFKFSTKKLVLLLFLSVFFALILSHATNQGVRGFPFLFALSSSATGVAVNILPKPFVDMRKKFVAALMSTVSCVPLSLFLVDLFYLPSFASPVIGGNGLNDGILLSTLFAPLGVTLVVSIFVYLSRTIWLVQQFLGFKTLTPQTKTTISENKK